MKILQKYKILLLLYPSNDYMKKIMMILVLFLLFAITFIFFLPSGFCDEIDQNILYVGGAGEGNYSGINEAINASSDGDTIFVFSGTYIQNESILINKSINLIGENQKKTIIQYKDSSSLNVNAPNITITGFTLQDGLLSGISLSFSDNCSIYRNIFDNNNIGITILASSNCTIFENNIINSKDTGISFPELYSMGPFTVNNKIYHNNFVNNARHAYDLSKNEWSLNNEGNYWDNYSGIDKNNDGIGETPYNIEGGNNQDEYPLISEYQGRIIVEKYYVDENSVLYMLVIGCIIAAIFCIPIGLWWRKKYFK